jgi:hypothetical protein
MMRDLGKGGGWPAAAARPAVSLGGNRPATVQKLDAHAPGREGAAASTPGQRSVLRESQVSIGQMLTVVPASLCPSGRSLWHTDCSSLPQMARHTQ